jgi:hypothetical protein
MPSGKTMLLLLVGGAVVCLLYTLTVVVIHRNVRVRYKNGDWVEMKPASLYESIAGGACEINIRTASREGRIVFHQDMHDSPVLVVPAGSINVFYCIFDYDVDTQLVRIDLNKPFQPAPRKGFVRSNVIVSTCGIERVEREDTAAWAVASGALEQMSAGDYRRQAAGLNMLFWTVVRDRQTLLGIVKNHGNQGTYGQDF